MANDFVGSRLPSFAQVIPGMEEVALLATIEEVAREDLLAGPLNWINHPDWVNVAAERRGGETFRLLSHYRDDEYEALVRIEGDRLVYVRPWRES